MTENTVTLSQQQASVFAAAILPNIRAYIEANRREFERWQEQRQKQQEAAQ